MSANPRRILPDALMPLSEYAQKRTLIRKHMVEIKRDRRVAVGPFATFHFESYDTMWAQVMEMLHIEKGGPEQVEGELDAYNPLIPQGDELIATLMLEIDDPVRRNRELVRLAGIETSCYIELGTHRIPGTPTEYDERTSADGKTSSVHWVRFRFSSDEQRKFADPATAALLGIAHPAYGHMAVLSVATRAALSKDFAAS
ncbi:MAG: DUF3501 family protein [Alphaproteobacteria bacterium]|nr:DUF3501 family protein [Alphaproteobacteria bacterium]